MTVEKRSPLGGLEVAGDEVTIRETPFLAQVGVRVYGDEGAEIATRVATAVEGSEMLRLGPDEWLVVGPPGSEAAIERDLAAALPRALGSVVGLSANRTAIEVRGPRARDVLVKGCSIDLHPRAFGPGRCAQTLVARTQAILQQLDDEPAYRLLVRGSFSDYLATWLLDAAAEYGVSPRRRMVSTRQRSVRATSLNV